jgi:hypothetical protein
LIQRIKIKINSTVGSEALAPQLQKEKGFSPFLTISLSLKIFSEIKTLLREKKGNLEREAGRVRVFL